MRQRLLMAGTDFHFFKEIRLVTVCFTPKQPFDNLAYYDLLGSEFISN
jgi:hypothetical protein